jgi:hypothetical protein
MKVSTFFLLLAAALLLPTGALFAKYTENLTVQVFDQLLRPVEGAQVYVEYELNSVKGNIKTKPKITDSSGNANMIFTNYEEIENSTSYDFTIYVKYGDQLVSGSAIAVNGEKRIYTMMVESHIAFVRVLDQTGKPLAANLTVGGTTKENTDLEQVFFVLPPGNYTLKVEHGELVKNFPLQLDNSTGDKNIDIVLSYYNLDINVQDDLGNPLLVQADVNGMAGQTDEKGVAHFENISSDMPLVTVWYGQSIKRLTPDLKTSSVLDVVFDLNKPEIKEQYSTLSPSGVGTIRFFVEDFGPQASGIDTVAVSYDVVGVQNHLSVYTIGYNSFEAKVPSQPPGTLVKYTVEVSDKEGNAVVGYGTYVIPPIEPEKNSTVQPPPPAASGQPISNEAIFVGIVVIAVLAYAAIYYYNKKKGEAPVHPSEVTPPKVPPVR